jgi:hypothetical protein
MHLALKKGTNIFHYTRKLSEFTFHYTKISMVDMKVQMYSKFSKRIWKKMISPSFMRNGKFHPSKSRGKVQKTGGETLKGLFSNFFILVAHLLDSCSQLLVVGSSTCPSCPSNFQTPITFYL